VFLLHWLNFHTIITVLLLLVLTLYYFAQRFVT
jgi:hypothetical protein